MQVKKKLRSPYQAKKEMSFKLTNKKSNSKKDFKSAKELMM